MKNALKFLSGSAATYFLMAACADAPSGPRARGVGGDGTSAAAGDAQVAMGGTVNAGGASSGMPGASAGSPTSSAGIFGMTDPVPDASAAGGEPSSGPTIVISKCEAVQDRPDQYAFADFPGKTKEELVFAMALFEFAPGSVFNPPPGFSGKQSFDWVADGRVAVSCPDVAHILSVRFVLR